LNLYSTPLPIIPAKKISLAGSIIMISALAGAVYTETRKKKETVIADKAKK
jgi:hypothetical protein